ALLSESNEARLMPDIVCKWFSTPAGAGHIDGLLRRKELSAGAYLRRRASPATPAISWPRRDCVCERLRIAIVGCAKSPATRYNLVRRQGRFCARGERFEGVQRAQILSPRERGSRPMLLTAWR